MNDKFSYFFLLWLLIAATLLMRPKREVLKAEEIRRRYKEVRSYREPRVLPDWFVWVAVVCVIGAVVATVILVTKP